MSKEGSDKKKYDRIATLYDFMETPMEILAFSSWRKELMDLVEGDRVLEVGIGTGKNIQYYGEWDVVGIDISRKMLEKALIRSKRSGKRVQIVQTDVESLPFKDGVFEGVISTYVFCSVENPVKGLREVYRVLKPQGKAYFLEHVRSESEMAGKLMDILNPVFKMIGPEINRRTVENIKKAGFKIIQDRNLMTSVFRLVIAEKTS
ncbi:class I SAM-dependent methyltransferase [Geoglobus sp.]